MKININNGNINFRIDPYQDITDTISSTFTTGYYLMLNGNITYNSQYSLHTKVEVSEGDTYKFIIPFVKYLGFCICLGVDSKVSPAEEKSFIPVEPIITSDGTEEDTVKEIEITCDGSFDELVICAKPETFDQFKAYKLRK